MPFDPSEPSPIASLPNTSWPTNNQLSGIGAVAVAWSWLELSLEMLLCTLSQNDDALSQALTADLSPDNRIKALKRIATTWERVLDGKQTKKHGALLVEIKAIAPRLAALKGRRNVIVHSLWMRESDARLFGWKHSTLPVDDGAKSSGIGHLTREEALAFSREVGALAERLVKAELAARALPILRTASLDMPPLPGLASLLSPYLPRSAPSRRRRPSPK